MAKNVYKKGQGVTPAAPHQEPARKASPVKHIQRARTEVDTSWYYNSPKAKTGPQAATRAGGVDTSWYYDSLPAAKNAVAVAEPPRRRRRRRRRFNPLPFLFLGVGIFIISLVAWLVLAHDELAAMEGPAGNIGSGIGSFIQNISVPDFIDLEAISGPDAPNKPSTSLSSLIWDAPADDISQWPALQEAVLACDDAAFMAVDITTGRTISYQPDKTVYLASAVKAPYALYAYRQMDAGALNMDTLLTYTADLYDAGTGEIKLSQPGTQFTLGYCIQESLHCSDNIGYRMAVLAGGKDGYNQMIDGYGIEENLHFTATNIWPKATPREMAVVWSDILDYTESSAPHAQIFKDNLLGTRYSPLRSALGLQRTVADKHGWQDASFCECAIVYDDAGKPLYLVIMLTGNGAHEAGTTYSMTYRVLRALIDILDQEHQEG